MAKPPQNVNDLFSIKVDNVNYDDRDFVDVRNEIKDAFRKYAGDGDLADVHLPRHKNYVFVRFFKLEEAEDAVAEMDGKEMFGGEIRCVMGTKRKKDKDEYRNQHDSRRGDDRRDDRRGGRSRSRGKDRRRRDDSRDRGRRRDDSRDRRRRDDSRKRR